MSITPQNMYMLIEGVLDEGLPFVASYLESHLKAPLLICDYDGNIKFPEIGIGNFHIKEHFLDIPSEVKNKKYFYNEKDRSLYYRVPYDDKNAYVLVKQCNPHQLFSYMTVLKEAELAIKCYFSKLNKNQNKFEEALKEYFFGVSRLSIQDIVQMSEKDIDPYDNYFGVIIEVEATSTNDMKMIQSYFVEYLRVQGYDVLSILNEDLILTLIPIKYRKNNYQDVHYTLPDYINNYKDMIEEKFDIHISIGIGQTYPLLNIIKSFQEAQIAVTLPRLTGKSNFVQKFSELGIYYPIFSQDIEKIIDYCLEKIGPLIENDYKTDGELLLTLRRLLDSCVNIKSTADSLFIHVNTLYYRMNRIEQILNVDLSKMETRVELYTAIKVWDTLKAIGYIHTYEGKDTDLSLQPMHIGG
ncbi:MAG: PucR family transcriptional regulator [Syntrophomonadaceae bacterium]|nr:PucR family transcriptional regulator [Syntrophomonadaceae bacterium]